MRALKSDNKYTMDVLAIAEEIRRIAINQGKPIVIAAYPETPDMYAFADLVFGMEKYHTREGEPWEAI